MKVGAFNLSLHQIQNIINNNYDQLLHKINIEAPSNKIAQKMRSLQESLPNAIPNQDKHNIYRELDITA